MEEKFHHAVLVVDKDENLTGWIEKTLAKIGVTMVSAPSGELGVERIRNAVKPFSIIISAQHLSDIQGYEFLEKARKLTPGSVRFFVAEDPTMDVIIAAVNRGSIFCYLLKPLGIDQFFRTVRSGLAQYEVGLENVQLLALAKEQNAKLYMYNCDLKERAESHQKTLEQLDREIKKITLFLEHAEGETLIAMSVLALVRENKLLTQGKMTDFYTNLMGQMFLKFQALAEKNGFSMPETIGTGERG
ncbi:MAG: hypothetical protein RBR67_14710 [Desulfobacterium sp.]|jgi:response regulator RpfG family c-di-GMP phosphodiesterase|nr:hypothetical protein [Desulfobacterium sp.]